MTQNTPGSDEAIKQGCTCPRMDNNYGKGGYKGTIVSADCPLHGNTQDSVERIVEEFDVFAQINDFYQRGFPMTKTCAWLRTTLTKALEEVREETEVEAYDRGFIEGQELGKHDAIAEERQRIVRLLEYGGDIIDLEGDLRPKGRDTLINHLTN